MIGEVYGLNRMLVNSLRHQCLGTEWLPAGRISHICAGLAASGALRRASVGFQQAPLPVDSCVQAEHASEGKVDRRRLLRKAVVGEGPHVKTKRIAAKRMRESAWRKHVTTKPVKSQRKRKLRNMNPGRVHRNVEGVIDSQSQTVTGCVG